MPGSFGRERKAAIGGEFYHVFAQVVARQVQLNTIAPLSHLPDSMSVAAASPRKRRRPLIGDDDTDEEERGAQAPAASFEGIGTRSRASTRSPSIGPGSTRINHKGPASASPLGSPVRSFGLLGAPTTRKSQRGVRGSGSPSESPSTSRATSPIDSKRPVRVMRQTARATARAAALNAAEAVASTRLKNGRVPGTDVETDKAKKEEEDRKEDEERRQRWRDEFFEIVEQLPLELHRSFSLMKELEAQMLDRLYALQRDSESYRDARRQLNSWTEAHGPTGRAPEEPEKASEVVRTDEQARTDEPKDLSSFKKETVKVPPTDHKATSIGVIPTPPSRAARMGMLSSLIAASNDAIRAAEEKSGLAATAYDWVDRHIRRLDGDLQRGENALLLGLRVGTEESRGLREALGTGAAGATIEEKRERLAALGGSSIVGAGRARQLRITLTGPPSGRVGSSLSSAGLKSPTPALPATTDGPQRARRPPPKKRNAKPTGVDGLQSLDFMHDMPVEENEPKYCYCDQVSFGDMIACDDEFCPREWYHYSCIGMNAPPKGRWYCQFCAPSGWRGPGMAVPADAVAKPPGAKK